MNILATIILLFLTLEVLASQTQEADVHEILKKGNLPRPYGSFYVHIKVDENHSISHFEVKVTGKPIFFNELKLELLENIDINRVYIGHEIFRKNREPFEKLDPNGVDYFEIKIGSKNGYKKDNIWFADHFTISVDLQSGKAKMLETLYQKP